MITPIKEQVFNSAMVDPIDEDKPAVIEYCRRLSSDQLSTKLKKNELVIEILERLPIKSLVRFRSVAKSWTSLFKEPIFIENHRRKQGSKATMLLIDRLSELRSDNGMLSFHDLDFPETEVRPKLYLKFIRDLLGIPKIQEYYSSCQVDSCKGIVCINYFNEFILCNPALHEFKRLPIHSFRKDLLDITLGVDSSSNDITVFVMHGEYGEEENPSNCETHVYNSRTNSWRRIDDAATSALYDIDTSNSVFLNGSFYWLAGPTKPKLVCFDISSEVFKELQVPHERCSPPSWKLIVANESLCVGVYDDSSGWELWVMKEHGVEQSWTKMFMISDMPFSTRYQFLPWKNDIYLVHETDDVFPHGHAQLASYSLCTNQTKYTQVYGPRFRTHIIKHEESLVGLN